MANQTTHDPSYWHNPRAFQFEHDERWSKVDAFNWSKLHAAGSQPAPELLNKVLQSSQDSGLPTIAVSPAQGKFLSIQARLMQARNILEVGMLGGYSTIWLASSHPDVKVTSLEIDESFIKLAKTHFEWAGVADQIEVKQGAAIDTFPSLVQEVKEGKRPKLDMVFIDANKENNLEYFNFALEMSRPGTCIVIDNVVRRGGVIDPSKADDPRIKGTIRAIEGVGSNKRVDATILQVVGDKSYDGFLTAIVKE
jgi:predicted O-methyltransferase YrrM